ncbi:MAG TPA: hypothetical protein VFP87_05830, partial [Chitinophagaceae bacterium]|nr:hypothetical protein [Chitinophagaceae bacterium]
MKGNIILFLVLVSMGGLTCRKAGSMGAPPREKRWVVTTFAGNGLASFSNGPNLSAAFRAPLDIVVTNDGTIFVADAINHRIRKIEQGQVSTFVGTGVEDTTSGNSIIAGFAFPSYLTLDATNNLYTLDVKDARVRKVSPDGFVSVVAGNGTNGFADGPAGIAEFGIECSGI